MPQRGIVFSDTHLYAPYSNGWGYMPQLYGALVDADICVLDGDIFEAMHLFRPLENIIAAAQQWMRMMSRRFPGCEFHYVLGNHERCGEFVEAMQALAEELPNLTVHIKGVRIGDGLFVHGDQLVDGPKDLLSEPYAPQKELVYHFFKRVVHCAGNILVLPVAREIKFPQYETLERLHAALQEEPRQWHEGIQHIFFGHIHRFFEAVTLEDGPFAGVKNYNTGAAIRGHTIFQPFAFEVSEEGKLENIQPLLAKREPSFLERLRVGERIAHAATWFGVR